jgi:hypothetical protein
LFIKNNNLFNNQDLICREICRPLESHPRDLLKALFVAAPSPDAMGANLANLHR